jgi:hypothetical protein
MIWFLDSILDPQDFLVANYPEPPHRLSCHKQGVPSVVHLEPSTSYARRNVLGLIVAIVVLPRIFATRNGAGQELLVI